MDATTARAILARTPGLKTEHARALVLAADASDEHLCDTGVIASVDLPSATREFLSAPDETALRMDLEWMTESGAQVLLCTDSAYPALLSEISSPPPVLYVIGSLEALQTPQMAVVGSRTPTPGGRAIAREFAASFAQAGLTVTSGLALGIDAASHEGALAGGGLTIAVLGTGLDTIYPGLNSDLALRIRRQGALVSEFPPRTQLRRSYFPRRNRIISGLSLGTLVVEAALESGSLITARCAADQGREVFAVPGSIHSHLTRGCHQLIREGATLVEEPAQVLSELRFPLSAEGLKGKKRGSCAAPTLDKEYEMLLDAVGFEPVTIDALASRTGLPGGVIASMLLILELEGCVAALPGGRFGRAA